MRLVDDVRHFWKWFSVQAMALAVAVQGAWTAFSDDLKQNVPHWLVTALSLMLLAAGIAGRLIKQDRKDG